MATDRLGLQSPLLETASGKRAERLDLLAEAASRLLKGDCPHEVVEMLRPKVMGYLDCQLFLYFLMGADGLLHLRNHAGIMPTAGYPEKENFESPPLQDLKTAGIKVYACEPLVSRARVLGTLVLGSCTRRMFSHEEISLLRGLSYQLTMALEQRSREDALRATCLELEELLAERASQPEGVQVPAKRARVSRTHDHQRWIVPSAGFAELYDIAPLGYLILDMDGLIREINLTGTRLLQANREELIGRSFRDFLTKSDWPTFTNHLMRCGQALSPMTTELRLIGATDELHVQLHTVPVPDPQGKHLLRTAMTDISDLKKTERNLLRLNRFYAVLREVDNVIIRAGDAIGLYHDVCRAIVQQGGLLLAWIGMTDPLTGILKPVASCGIETEVLERVTLSVHDRDRSPMIAAICDGKHFISNDFANEPCSDQWREAGLQRARAAAAIALQRHGKLIGALIVFSEQQDFFAWQFTDLLQQMAADISFALDNFDREASRRKAEQDLQKETVRRLQAAEELREKEQLLMQQSRQAAMGEVIGNIAHQWRQPLNTLGLLIQELPAMYDLGDFDRAYLGTRVDKAMTVIQHMSQTIDDFRNFFKPDRVKNRFKLNDVIKKTASLVEASFRELQVAVSIKEEAEVVVEGYPNEFSQVLLNILGNARDAFAARRPVDPVLVVTVGTAGSRAVVSVTDNAGGIPESIIDRIFDPYFTTKGPAIGTGVGLFMAKTIIEKNMHGSLTVRNTGTGAEFRMEV